MKIGLLGGSFNPAHLGHLHISKLATKKLRLNQIWWLLNYNPFKEKSAYSSEESRLQACETITKNDPQIKVKNIFSECIYTYDLVKKIKKKYPNCQFYWIMGADNLDKFHQWENFDRLIKEIEVVVFSRQEYLKKARETKALQLYFAKKKYAKKIDKKIVKKKTLPKISLNRTKNYDISSTQLRGL